jgi:hypothetical protein
MAVGKIGYTGQGCPLPWDDDFLDESVGYFWRDLGFE